MDVKIAITRYNTMIIRYEATQEMYSPKSPENGVKSRNTRNTCTPPIHILIYILYIINIREIMREEREREEFVRERRLRERERESCR